MPNITLQGDYNPLSYSVAAAGASPLATYSAWASELGVSDTGSDVPWSGGDDSSAGFHSNAHLFATASASENVILITEGGLGLFASLTAGAGTFYWDDLPSLVWFVGPRTVPKCLLTWKNDNGDYKMWDARIRVANTAAIIYAKQSRYSSDTLDRYEVAIKITDGAVTLVGNCIDTATSIYFFEFTEEEKFNSPVSFSLQQQVTLVSQTPGQTHQVTLAFPFTPTANIIGPGLLGNPQATALAGRVAWMEGTGLVGALKPLVDVQPAGILMSAGLVGVPGIAASQTLAWLSSQGFIGIPQAHALAGYDGRLTGPGLLGTPALFASHLFGYLASSGLIGAPRATAFALPDVAPPLTDAITYYYAKLTGAADGLADAVLPMSSFSVRHRYDGPSYYQLTIPSYAYVSAIAARPNGQIVIWSKTGDTEEELMRGDLGNVRTDRGPKSQSISINGNSERAATLPMTYVLRDALYVYSTFEGDARLRIQPRAAIRPGDYLRYQDLNFEIGEVSWSVAVSTGGMAITMEVVNRPITMA